MDRDALESALRVFLAEELGVGPVERDDELLSAGLIDSVDLAGIATFLEEHTGIQIPDYDIGAANFDSIAAISTYVAGRLR